MDISVTSIDMLARLFNHSLRNRGFTRAIHREMYAGQSSGMQQHHFGVLGLVVAGELELELAEAHQTFGIGEEFTIPANIYFQATAGHSGAQLLLAKKKKFLVSTESFNQRSEKMGNKTSEKFSEVVDLYEDEIETPGDFHRMAAYHYTQAAKQHEAAAEAFDNDDQVSCDLHALRAYKHELNAREYSEMALIDTNDIDDIETAESIA